jgi:hypothetical protein
MGSNALPRLRYCVSCVLGSRLSRRCSYVCIFLSHDSRISTGNVSDTVHSVRLAPIISRFEPLAPISFLVNKDRIFRCFTVLASTLDRCSLSEIKYSATPLNYTSQAAFQAHRHLHVAEIQRYRVLTPSLPVVVPPWFALI